jgi:hypothetical protein
MYVRYRGEGRREMTEYATTTKRLCCRALILMMNIFIME